MHDKDLGWAYRLLGVLIILSVVLTVFFGGE